MTLAGAVRASLAVLTLFLWGCDEDPSLPPPEALLYQHERDPDLFTLPRVSDVEEYEMGCEPITDYGVKPHPRFDQWDCKLRRAVDREFPDLDVRQVKRQMIRESSGFVDAAGDYGEHGLMQLKVSTFRSMLPRGDIHDPADNLRAGVAYRFWCAQRWHKHLRSEEERNGPLSALCYNAGPRRAWESQAACGGYTFAEFGPCAPATSRRYVAFVMQTPEVEGRQ